MVDVSILSCHVFHFFLVLLPPRLRVVVVVVVVVWEDFGSSSLDCALDSQIVLWLGRPVGARNSSLDFGSDPPTVVWLGRCQDFLWTLYWF